jgi:hypothetical protein
MTADHVKRYVEGHSDEDARKLSDAEICEMFEAVYHRTPDNEDREEGLWLRISAAVLA